MAASRPTSATRTPTAAPISVTNPRRLKGPRAAAGSEIANASRPGNPDAARPRTAAVLTKAWDAVREPANFSRVPACEGGRHVCRPPAFPLPRIGAVAGVLLDPPAGDEPDGPQI